MKCEQARERLVEVQEGLLAADDAPEVRAHLEWCGACRAELERTTALHERLSRLAAEDGRAPVSDEGAATIVGELTMLRIGARGPGGAAAAGAKRVLRWVLPLAAAACLALALSLNFIWPQRASAISLAQMTENVRKAGSMAFNVKMEMDRSSEFPAIESRVTVQGGKRVRVDMSGLLSKNDRSVIISDAETATTLVLIPAMKAARRTVKAQGLDIANAYQWMLNLGKQKGTVIGEETIRGEATRVMRADTAAFMNGQDASALPAGSSVDPRVWIGVASGLPVRIEITVTAPVNGKTSTFVIAYSDFQFDAEYDPSFFSMDVPADYHVEGEAMAPAAGLKVATERLKRLAEAVRTYRRDRSFWPSDLAQVAPLVNFDDSLNDPRVAGTGTAAEFLYFRPVDGMLSDEGVLFEPGREGNAWPGSGLVGYLDGRVEDVTDRVRYQAMLQRARERAKRAR